MKIVQIEREICHKLYVAKYETIMPTVRIVATLENGDDPRAAKKELDKVCEAEWNRTALQELRMVHKRRNGQPVGDDTLPELMTHFKDAIVGS